ncbi:hypothetical protein [Paraburkholderia aromaticivorans]|uniref:hypothetical protein n=1 Tax=Paraburkholderia aromaticivorans TaxID=2026199 RepID=UPI001455E944|nr:hypothetical protein [Paraburkholderia aromaticivorans]
MLHHLHEFQQALMSPLTAWGKTASKSFTNTVGPFAYTYPQLLVQKPATRPVKIGSADGVNL